MSFSSKYTRSAEWFYFDFSTQLAPGDSVASLTEIVQETGDCVLTSPGIVGHLASVFITAGTPGATSTLRALALTTQGETLEVRDSFKIVP
jgi:hypothetical protein